MSWLWRCEAVGGRWQGARCHGDAGDVSYELWAGIAGVECGERLAEQRRLNRLGRFDCGRGDWQAENERQCRERQRAMGDGQWQRADADKQRAAAATGDGQGCEACLRHAERLAWASLAPFSKHEACSRQKSRPQTSSRAGLAGRMAATALGRNCIVLCKTQQGAPDVDLDAAGSMHSCPPYHTLPPRRCLRFCVSCCCAVSTLKRHPPPESVRRVETGARGVLQTRRALNFGIWRSDPERLRYRPSTHLAVASDSELCRQANNTSMPAL